MKIDRIFNSLLCQKKRKVAQNRGNLIEIEFCTVKRKTRKEKRMAKSTSSQTTTTKFVLKFFYYINAVQMPKLDFLKFPDFLSETLL